MVCHIVPMKLATQHGYFPCSDWLFAVQDPTVWDTCFDPWQTAAYHQDLVIHKREYGGIIPWMEFG